MPQNDPMCRQELRWQCLSVAESTVEIISHMQTLTCNGGQRSGLRLLLQFAIKQF